MSRLGDFLGKQGRFLLENDHVALVYIAILAVVPFAAWLSSAVIALITLRKGWSAGFKGLIVGVGIFSVLSLLSMPFLPALITSTIAFLPCYLTAGVLHSTASWKVAGFVLVLQVLVALVLLHWFAPELIMNQYQYIAKMLKEMAKESSDSSLASLLNDQNALSQQIFANYFLGIQSVSIVLSSLISIGLARSVQSRIFYPGGFKQEMLSFRASGLGVILLVLAAVGAYKHDPLAISCLPILVMYYVAAGLSLGFSLFAKERGIGTFILLIVPLALLPFFMLPLYVAIGALDSLFNVRLYLSSKGDGKENKG